MIQVSSAAFTDRQAAVVRALRAAGVPLDVLRVAAPRTDPPDLAHRAAVVHAVAAFAADRGVADDGSADPRRLLGVPLVRADLLGRRVDPATGRLLRWAAPDFFLAAGPDVRAVAVTDPAAHGGATLGGPLRLAGADGERWLVWDPSGPIWGLGEVVAEGGGDDELFAGLVGDLLGAGGDTVEAFRWTGNWSHYFDAGNEWWGGYAWTVRTDDGHVVVFGASWTD